MRKGTNTTNYQFFKPDDSSSGWGASMRGFIDIVDRDLFAVTQWKESAADSLTRIEELVNVNRERGDEALRAHIASNKAHAAISITETYDGNVQEALNRIRLSKAELERRVNENSNGLAGLKATIAVQQGEIEILKTELSKLKEIVANLEKKTSDQVPATPLNRTHLRTSYSMLTGKSHFISNVPGSWRIGGTPYLGHQELSLTSKESSTETVTFNDDLEDPSKIQGTLHAVPPHNAYWPNSRTGDTYQFATNFGNFKPTSLSLRLCWVSDSSGGSRPTATLIKKDGSRVPLTFIEEQLFQREKLGNFVANIPASELDSKTINIEIPTEKDEGVDLVFLVTEYGMPNLENEEITFNGYTKLLKYDGFINYEHSPERGEKEEWKAFPSTSREINAVQTYLDVDYTSSSQPQPTMTQEKMVIRVPVPRGYVVSKATLLYTAKAKIRGEAAYDFFPPVEIGYADEGSVRSEEKSLSLGDNQELVLNPSRFSRKLTAFTLAIKPVGLSGYRIYTLENVGLRVEFENRSAPKATITVPSIGSPVSANSVDPAEPNTAVARRPTQ